jgi:hypothetical protein
MMIANKPQDVSLSGCVSRIQNAPQFFIILHESIGLIDDKRGTIFFDCPKEDC